MERKNEELATLVGRKFEHEHRQFEARGVRYADDVSNFSNDASTSLAEGENYLDVFLGETALIERVACEQAGVKDASQLVMIATLDFYNYETASTKPGKGPKHDFRAEMSFKVVEDDFLIQYLEKDVLQVDIWTAEHMKSVQLGTAKIPLKALLLKSKEGIAPVVSSEASLYVSGVKVAGTVSFKMRMRLPIHHLLKTRETTLIKPV